MATTHNRFKNKDPTSDTPETKESSRMNEPKIKQFHYVSLSLVETILNWVIWLGTVAYMMYILVVVSNKHKDELYPEDFSKGWKIIGREKDSSDMEWEFWSSLKLEFVSSLAIHSIGGFIISYYIPKFKALFYLVYTLVFLVYLLGILPVVYMLVHLCIMYLASLSQSVLAVWGVALSILASLQMDDIRHWQYKYLTNDSQHRDLTLFISLMSLLRSISFCLDHCSHKKNTEEKEPASSYSFFNLLSYNFYLPLFNNGPVMMFDTFYKEFYQPPRPFTKEEILSLIWDSLRTLWWYICFEVYLHYVYSSAIVHEPPVFMDLSNWSLAALFYSQLHIFLTKYVVLYQLSRIFARLDRLDPPQIPRCVSSLYTFTDMWRYFDRGLNIWMKRYIYVPMGGSRKGVFRQLLGSFLAFGFVWAWHGGNPDTLWWFMPNWLGVAVEGFAENIAMSPLVMRVEEHLSLRMRRRIRAALCTVTLSGLILSNMVFLIGPRPVTIFVRRVFYQGFPSSSLVCLTCLYFSIQTSIDLNNYKGGQW
ncbi:protein-cysteine N-palmitoyltransferase HHAT-like [Actinia tenebrosa]|uniref:Protein-cysteine N-palmitoyltransferase HHAT-like n=1 Tax=Actinia tenebrosa TaxID=6105 RepID=A0A6P8HYS0_ACTTE|nr:protein-cysteine N-palmitoyltransferase HHAT-like [Actinia tenebrosa]XP_031557801.1 protein-cysteine N-palmitoyltransferase HHAT-like [Actinia tenebrosa]XP_031557802.1 protein-cysteine N-palmitoyltransferase HHAT-like [Actinia tenebrosa]XP_031557803.1 protein-cysteine N-palmitoyltransferase HHAT-like [Actinia tenebrosa]XP_031557804.1 protein-cysteine N-palmitoyltransferase HHAT-like [Actinia tenebrosa]XP_031557805.1 protein-cysteine N-palmitoyltransferase HHAT-like [Actinia tenebrosa]